MIKDNLPETAKRLWKWIVVAVASTIGITVAIVSIGLSIDVVHFGDININTGISMVNTPQDRTGTDQRSTDGVEQVAFQLEDLEPCTTYEFQASLDPNFEDAETTTFTTKCEE